jgi:putative transposase
MLNVVSMTESNSVEAKEKRQAKGKVKTPRPGSPATWSAKQKAALNAQVLDTAMGSLLKMIVYKAEEAGSRLVLLDPREHKPSQTCPHCMGQKYKGLEKRDHGCVCGYAATRDESAALVMLRIGLEEIGMGAIPDAWDWNIIEPVVEKDPQNHVLETPTRVALATWSG